MAKNPFKLVCKIDMFWKDIRIIQNILGGGRQQMFIIDRYTLRRVRYADGAVMTLDTEREL